MQPKSYLLSALLLSFLPSAVFAQTTTRVSTSAAGAQGGGDSGEKTVQISPSGRFILFGSRAANLGYPNTTQRWDLYLKDRASQSIERINSGLLNGVPNANGQADADVGFATFAGEQSDPNTGKRLRWVAFDSAASNHVSGDTNGVSDIFLKDRTAGTLVRVTVNSSGAQANGASTLPYISANGRYIAFQSFATNLTNDIASGFIQVYRYDRIKNTFLRISVSGAGVTANNSNQVRGISGDGRFVLFQSVATNLGDTAGRENVYLRDTVTGRTLQINSDASGAGANAGGYYSTISAGGRYISFQSAASNLVSGVAGTNLFLKDRFSGKVEVISKSTNNFLGNGQTRYSSISAGGRYVLFDSDSNNLVNDSNGSTDVFLRDRLAGTTTRISLTNANAESNGASFYGTISADGLTAAFASSATNLTNNDTNAKEDVFVRTGIASDPRPDFASEIRFQNSTNSDVQSWRLQDQSQNFYNYIAPIGNVNWKYVGSPDLNGDGCPDALFQYGGTPFDGTPYAWILDASTSTAISKNYLTLGGTQLGSTNFRFAASADLNRDGCDDLIFQNPDTGAVIYYLMKGTTVTAQGTLWNGGDNQWKIVAAADLDEDGVPDLIFQSQTTRGCLRWMLSSTATSVSVRSSNYIYSGSIPGYTIKAAKADPATGKVALFWQNDSSGEVIQWNLTNGVYDFGGFSFTSANLSAWSLVGVQDGGFNGVFTLIFQNKNNSSIAYWNTSSTGIASVGSVYNANYLPWKVIFTGNN